eukprot:jgi/Astpho2/3419/Aster-x0580
MAAWFISVREFQTAKALEDQALSADLQDCTRRYAALAGCQAVSVTLAAVKEATCPRFHADHVRLRGLVTYWQRSSASLTCRFPINAETGGRF